MLAAEGVRFRLPTQLLVDELPHKFKPRFADLPLLDQLSYIVVRLVHFVVYADSYVFKVEFFLVSKA